MDCLLNELEPLWKLVGMMEEEHDKLTQEFSLTSEWLVTQRARDEAVEASLEAKSAHLNEIMVECAKIYLVLADT